MSILTEKMVEALERIAVKLGEGLTATITMDRDRVYDPTTGTYSDSGTTESVTFPCAPPVAPKRSARGGGDEAEGSNPMLTMVRTLRSDGSLVEPQRGDRVEVSGRTYQVLAVAPIGFGDGTAGFTMELSS